MWGEYREIDEPGRIVMTWNREIEQRELWSSTLLTVTFESEGNRTHFRLYQALFETVEYRDAHEFGWSQCIDRLAKYAVTLAEELRNAK